MKTSGKRIQKLLQENEYLKRKESYLEQELIRIGYTTETLKQLTAYGCVQLSLLSLEKENTQDGR
jgi:hypothetical protein